MRLITMLFVLMLSAGSVAADTITQLTISGPAGEYISQGQTLIFGPNDGPFVLTHDSSTNNGIRVWFHTPNYSHWWTVEIGGPNGTSPQAGLYQNCQRFSNAAPDAPRLNVSGDGRGCNTLTGSFEVKYVRYNADGTVASLWVTFAQVCGNGNPNAPLRGEVLYQLEGPTPTLGHTWGQLKIRYR